MYYANINQIIMAILISDKVNRLLNKENYQRQRHYLLVKKVIYQEDIAILNVCVRTNRAEKQMEQKSELKRRDKSRNIVKYFNIRLSTTGRITCQKISRCIEELNITINQQDLIVSYTTLHPTRAEYASLQVSMEYTPGESKSWDLKKLNKSNVKS